jgi:serine/threonine protein phosphatase PrpC
MQCPACSECLPAENVFCEGCGQRLTDEVPTPPAKGCAKCGAGIEEQDESGFCMQCGFRSGLRERDHIEVELSPNFAGVTDRGLRHHRNEDYFALEFIDSRAARVLIVCDGVSSSQDADQASKVAAEAVRASLFEALSNPEIDPTSALKSALRKAQDAVCAIPYTSREDSGPPSTTIVSAVVINRVATIAWAGDSRAYWIGAEGAKQLTADDSWLNSIVAAGELTEEEALKSKQAHAITKWLGRDSDVDFESSLIEVPLSGPGILLLCTDGLWNFTPHPTDLGALVDQMNVEGMDGPALDISRKLVEFAIERGGHDNITAGIARFPEE